jgi:precorrin-8X/cobalt-precorrin-8 methylmutase
MSEELSPQGDITENMPIEPGAATREAKAIAARSRALSRQVVGDESPEDRIRQRCAVAVGDFAMAGLLRFCNGPVSAGKKALDEKALIITDIRMVSTGVLKRGHESRILCALDYGGSVAANEGITRTSAGIRALGDETQGSIVVIGNAPSALLALCRLMDEGKRPALVVGTPVGFVNAAESKDLLRKYAVPSISTEGTRGGTPVAVAVMNELIIMHYENSHAK